MSNVKKKKKVVHVKRNQCVCLVFFSFLFLHFVAFLLFYIVTNQTILSHFECLYLLHVSSIASNYVMGMNIKACFFMTTFLPSVDSCISSFTFSSFFIEISHVSNFNVYLYSQLLGRGSIFYYNPRSTYFKFFHVKCTFLFVGASVTN